MAELIAQVADRIDRAVQRVTPLAYRMQRKGRRWMRRAMRKPRSVSEGPNLLPLLIQVLASFSKADGVLLEEEIDSSLGFLRYDYPEAVYSELRQLFRQALYEQQDLTAMAQKLSVQLSTDRKIMLGVQLYDLISQAGLKQEQVVQFYSFMSQLGMAHRGDASPGPERLSRLARRWDDADIGGQGSRAGEVGRVSELGDELGSGCRADAIDGCQQRADFVFFELGLDVAVDVPEPLAKEVRINTRVASAGPQTDVHVDIAASGVRVGRATDERIDGRPSVVLERLHGEPDAADRPRPPMLPAAAVNVPCESVGRRPSTP